MEILVALVAILGTLSGLLLGKLWDKGDERRRWLRDSRAKSYAQYVENYQYMRQHIRRVVRAQSNADERQDALRLKRQLQDKYDYALVQLELFGSTEIYLSALRVDKAIREIGVKATREHLSVNQWHVERQEMDSAMRHCVDLIRRELKLSEHPSRSSWVSMAPSGLPD